MDLRRIVSIMLHIAVTNAIKVKILDRTGFGLQLSKGTGRSAFQAEKLPGSWNAHHGIPVGYYNGHGQHASTEYRLGNNPDKFTIEEHSRGAIIKNRKGKFIAIVNNRVVPSKHPTYWRFLAHPPDNNARLTHSRGQTMNFRLETGGRCLRQAAQQLSVGNCTGGPEETFVVAVGGHKKTSKKIFKKKRHAVKSMSESTSVSSHGTVFPPHSHNWEPNSSPPHAAIQPLRYSFPEPDLQMARDFAPPVYTPSTALPYVHPHVHTEIKRMKFHRSPSSSSSSSSSSASSSSSESSDYNKKWRRKPKTIIQREIIPDIRSTTTTVFKHVPVMDPSLYQAHVSPSIRIPNRKTRNRLRKDESSSAEERRARRRQQREYASRQSSSEEISYERNPSNFKRRRLRREKRPQCDYMCANPKIGGDAFPFGKDRGIPQHRWTTTQGPPRTGPLLNRKVKFNLFGDDSEEASFRKTLKRMEQHVQNEARNELQRAQCTPRYNRYTDKRFMW